VGLGFTEKSGIFFAIVERGDLGETERELLGKGGAPFADHSGEQIVVFLRP
jgi:hypothetical protein